MPRQMKRILNKSHGFEQAEKWDIHQQLNMTPDERFAAAKELKRIVYGINTPDVREWHRKK